MKIKYLLWIILSLSTAYAKENEGNVVNLGDISIQGELRRPSVTWIESRKPLKESIHHMVESEFEKFEAELLLSKPVTQEKKLESKNVRSENDKTKK